MIEMSKQRGSIMNNIENAVELFSSGMLCSQAVLTVFGERYGLGSDEAKRLGRTLGGGMARTGRTCGAVTGAALILGLAKGDEDEGKARKITYSSVQELFRRFEAMHGTTDCKSLLGTDLDTEEGLKKAQTEQLFTKLCPGFVRDAATILEELLST
jgi:C_GCAxxG_C_C family probable redox protein